MNHPNRNWHSTWTIDVAQREARHQITGLVVRFTKNATGYCGSIFNLEEVSTALERSTPLERQGLLIGRLLKQANQRYVEKLNEKESNEDRLA